MPSVFGRAAEQATLVELVASSSSGAVAIVLEVHVVDRASADAAPASRVGAPAKQLRVKPEAFQRTVNAAGLRSVVFFENE